MQLWPKILADVESGSLQPRYEADFSRPYHMDPPARRTILPRASFLTTSSVIATRGCHNRCGFCYLSTDGLHMPYRMRKVQQVVDEIVADQQPYVVFVDNNLGSRPDYLRALCAALRPLKIIWSAAITIDVTNDPTLVREMALAGCTGVFVGFESVNGGNLIDSRKKTPAPEDYARRVAVLHRYSIQVNGSFVLGFDHDQPDVFERTVDWIEANRLECATFQHLDALPRNAIVSPTRIRKTHFASRLGSLRHSPRCIPAEAYESRGARSRLCLVLRASIFASLDLEATPRRPARRARLSGNELPLQAL